jgi:hypothetical protein
MPDPAPRPFIRVMAIRPWGISLHSAAWYGWRWCLHIGPLLIWWGKGDDNA